MKASLALSGVAFSLLVSGCQPEEPKVLVPTGKVDEVMGLHGEDVEPFASFVYGPNLVGEVRKSVLTADLGKSIIFSGLDGDQPSVTFQGSGGASPLRIVFETDAEIGVQLNTGHSLDSFVIDKKTGLFARTWSGNFDGVYAGASLGACK